MASKQFQYKPDPDLQRAKEQLRAKQQEMGDRNAIRQRLAFKVGETKDALDLLQLKAQYERVPAQTIAAAQAAYDVAQKALADADQAPDNPEALRWLMAKIEELEQRERKSNTDELRPICIEQLRRLDAKLREAAEIAAEYQALVSVSGPLGVYLPQALADVLLDVDGPYGTDSRLKRWREDLIAAGWLTK